MHRFTKILLPAVAALFLLATGHAHADMAPVTKMLWEPEAKTYAADGRFERCYIRAAYDNGMILWLHHSIHGVGVGLSTSPWTLPEDRAVTVRVRVDGAAEQAGDTRKASTTNGASIMLGRDGKVLDALAGGRELTLTPDAQFGPPVRLPLDGIEHATAALRSCFATNNH